MFTYSSSTTMSNFSADFSGHPFDTRYPWISDTMPSRRDLSEGQEMTEVTRVQMSKI